MAQPLDSAFAKLRHAEERLETLNQEVGGWREKVKHSFSDKKNADRTEIRLYVHSNPPPETERWALLIGDVVHGLRSSLDHTVWRLSNPKPRGCEFPIFVRRADYFRSDRDRRGGLYKIKGIRSPEVRTIIERAQPWQRRKRPSDDPLWLVHDLDRKDKHRLLTPVGSLVREIGFAFEIAYTEDPVGTTIRGPKTVALQEKAFLFAMTSESPMATVKMNVKFAAQISLRHGTLTQAVSTGLGDACQRTRRLVEEIRDAVV